MDTIIELSIHIKEETSNRDDVNYFQHRVQSIYHCLNGKENEHFEVNSSCSISSLVVHYQKKYKDEIVKLLLSAYLNGYVLSFKYLLVYFQKEEILAHHFGSNEFVLLHWLCSISIFDDICGNSNDDNARITCVKSVLDCQPNGNNQYSRCGYLPIHLCCRVSIFKIYYSLGLSIVVLETMHAPADSVNIGEIVPPHTQHFDVDKTIAKWRLKIMECLIDCEMKFCNNINLIMYQSTTKSAEVQFPVFMAIEHQAWDLVMSLLEADVNMKRLYSDMVDKSKTQQNILHYIAHFGSVYLNEMKGIAMSNSATTAGDWESCPVAYSENSQDIVLAIVQLILHHYPSLLIKPEVGGYLPLHIACQSGCLEVVKLLVSPMTLNLSECYTPSFRTPTRRLLEGGSGRTPLHFAAQCGHLDIVRELLAFNENHVKPNLGVDLVQCASDDGRLALHLAAFNGNVDIVQILLSLYPSGVSVFTHEFCLTPLHIACCFGHTDLVKLLLKYCPIDIITGKLHIDMEPPIVIAIKNQRWDIVLLFLKTFSQLCYFVSAKDGRSVLHSVCLYGKVVTSEPNSLSVRSQNASIRKIIYILLGIGEGSMEFGEEESDQVQNALTAQDSCGYTPLHMSCESLNIEIIHIILMTLGRVRMMQKHSVAHADVHLDSHGPLSDREYMLYAKELICVQAVNGRTPLHFAVQYRLLDAISLFLDMSPESAKIQSKDGRLPLHLAVFGSCSESNLDLVQKLLQIYPDSVFVTTTDGLLPIHIACDVPKEPKNVSIYENGGVELFEKKLNVVKVLLALNGDGFNRISAKYDIHFAISSQNWSLVMWLFENEEHRVGNNEYIVDNCTVMHSLAHTVPYMLDSGTNPHISKQVYCMYKRLLYKVCSLFPAWLLVHDMAGFQPLHYACARANHIFLEIFIGIFCPEYGVKCNPYPVFPAEKHAEEWEKTAVSMSRIEYFNAIELLFNSGELEMKSPLCRAALCGQPICCDFILNFLYFAWHCSEHSYTLPSLLFNVCASTLQEMASMSSRGLHPIMCARGNPPVIPILDAAGEGQIECVLSLLQPMDIKHSMVCPKKLYRTRGIKACDSGKVEILKFESYEILDEQLNRLVNVTNMISNSNSTAHISPFQYFSLHQSCPQRIIGAQTASLHMLLVHFCFSFWMKANYPVYFFEVLLDFYGRTSSDSILTPVTCTSSRSKHESGPNASLERSVMSIFYFRNVSPFNSAVDTDVDYSFAPIDYLLQAPYDDIYAEAESAAVKGALCAVNSFLISPTARCGMIIALVNVIENGFGIKCTFAGCKRLSILRIMLNAFFKWLMRKIRTQLPFSLSKELYVGISHEHEFNFVFSKQMVGVTSMSLVEDSLRTLRSDGISQKVLNLNSPERSLCCEFLHLITLRRSINWFHRRSIILLSQSVSLALHPTNVKKYIPPKLSSLSKAYACIYYILFNRMVHINYANVWNHIVSFL